MQQRWLTVPLLFSLAFLSGCDIEEFGSSQRYQADFQESHPLKAGSRLYVENSNGSIDITGWDQETADISGTKYASSEAALAAVKIDILASGDSLRIRTVRPSGHLGNLGAKYLIRVPRSTVLERIESSNGAIRVHDINSSARLETSNGAIELLSVSGPVTLKTSNGSIRADNVEKGIDASTSNGPIRVGLGKLEDRRSVRLATSNGGVEFSVDDLRNSDVTVTTSNGPITARLPGALASEVKATTSNASVTNEFESEFHGDSRKNHLEGTIAGGGPLLTLKTSNGPIRLLKR